jgi:hypothetical protein
MQVRNGRRFHLTPLIWVCSGLAYRYQGCYTDSTTGPFQGGTRSLPQVHDNLRQGVSLDECAAAARIKGWPVFALQWYGQCFFGSMADVARLQAASQKLSDDKCNSLPCPGGAATCPGNINKIFVLIGAHTRGCLWLRVRSRCN